MRRTGSTVRPVLFDVGANVGKYASLLLSVFGDDAIIYSFEPSAKTFEILQRNVGSQGNVHLFQYGIGDESYTMTLFSNGDGCPLASTYKRKLDHFGIEMTQEEQIEIITLGDFCHSNGVLHIDLLKLDVEGHELRTLKGSSEMLNSGSIVFIQFEFGGANIDSRTYFQDFFTC